MNESPLALRPGGRDQRGGRANYLPACNGASAGSSFRPGGISGS